MDYSRNSKFVVYKENQNLSVKNDLELNSGECKVFKVDENGKIGKTEISGEKFFVENKNGIFLVKVCYENNEKECQNRYYIKIKDGKLILQRSRFPKDLSGYTEPFSDSEFNTSKLKIDSDDYLKILEFYIIECPSVKNGKPMTAKYFDIKKLWKRVWWKNDSLKPKLVNAIIEYNNTKFEDCVKKFNSEADSKYAIEVLKLHDKASFDNKIKIGVVDICNNIFMSIFRHIRNGFAHGRFYFYESDNKMMLFLEDVNKDKVTARMTIPVEQLISWIDIIKNTNSDTDMY